MMVMSGGRADPLRLHKEHGVDVRSGSVLGDGNVRWKSRPPPSTQEARR